MIEITGKTLWEVFEYSVSALPDELEGRFLQVSGRFAKIWCFGHI